MSKNQEETLKIWEQEQIEFEGYDYNKLEPYLDVFDILPLEDRVKIIRKFSTLVVIYLMDNKKNNIPMHTKAISKALYQKIKKELKVTQDFLKILEDYKDKNIYKTKTEIEDFIRNETEIIESKAVTKTMIKKFLLEINKEFELKKTLEIKQLVDNI